MCPECVHEARQTRKTFKRLPALPCPKHGTPTLDGDNVLVWELYQDWQAFLVASQNLPETLMRLCQQAGITRHDRERLMRNILEIHQIAVELWQEKHAKKENRR